MKLVLAVAFVLLPVSAVFADSIDRGKVYVSKPEGCKAIKAKGVSAFQDGDFEALTFKDGIQADEFHCSFYDVKANSNSDAILVQAICEEPGNMYPDLLAISPYSDGTIQVISMAAAQQLAAAPAQTPTPDTTATATAAAGGDTSAAGSEEQPSATTIFTRCDKLSELPRD